MKRTPLDLFGASIDPAPVVGADLDAVYTMDTLADLCVERVVAGCPELPIGCDVVEPSVGGGAFARSLRKRLPCSRLIGVDVDPDANGHDVVDWSIVADVVEWSTARAVRPGLIIGNPPFSDAIAHVEALLRMLPMRLALILPSDRAGRQGWRSLLYGEPVEGMRLLCIDPIFPRPWPHLVREVSLYVWGESEPVARTIGDPIDWRNA